MGIISWSAVTNISKIAKSSLGYLVAGKIIMSTLPPISTKGKTVADLDILLEKTQAIMEEEFQNLRREVHKGYIPLKT